MTPFKGRDVRGDGLSRDDRVASQFTWLCQRVRVSISSSRQGDLLFVSEPIADRQTN